MKRTLILNVTVMGLGMHPGAWRYRSGKPYDFLKLDYFLEIARIAEAGTLHAIFLADTLTVGEENFERPSLGAMDPTIVLAGIAAATRSIGLVATSSTTYNEPFNIARRFAALDHLTGGRAGWNVVTTFVPDVSANFGSAVHLDHSRRYGRAEEFVEVVRALWRTWDEAAVVGDKKAGVFADASRVRAINHQGEHFSVRGPLTLPRSPQGWPVVFQAGSSERGRELAARQAEVVFTAQNTLDAAQAFYTDVRRRALAHGREPDGVKILPGLLPILGGTEAEARERKAELDELSGHEPELRKLAARVGVAVEDLELDAPLPLNLIRANAGFNASHGFRDAAVQLAESENLTVRELLYRNGGGHRQVVGTPEQVADLIETWFSEGAADGFNLMIDVFPDGLSDFVNHVVPLLRRKGIFRDDYTGDTLRSNLCLPLPDGH
jgi:FMN-dependent oxidoreductase (nitrilotriacetate monooxygenase family)